MAHLLPSGSAALCTSAYSFLIRQYPPIRPGAVSFRQHSLHTQRVSFEIDLLDAGHTRRIVYLMDGTEQVIFRCLRVTVPVHEILIQYFVMMRITGIHRQRTLENIELRSELPTVLVPCLYRFARDVQERPALSFFRTFSVYWRATHPGKSGSHQPAKRIEHFRAAAGSITFGTDASFGAPAQIGDRKHRAAQAVKMPDIGRVLVAATPGQSRLASVGFRRPFFRMADARHDLLSLTVSTAS